MTEEIKSYHEKITFEIIKKIIQEITQKLNIRKFLIHKNIQICLVFCFRKMPIFALKFFEKGLSFAFTYTPDVWK